MRLALLLVLLVALTADASARDAPNSAPTCSFSDPMTQMFAAPNRLTHYTVRPGATAAFGFTCQDADGDNWTATVGGSAGTVTGANLVRSVRPGQADYDATYTPPAGFTGDDTLTVNVDDGHGGVTTGTFTFHAGTANTPPNCSSFTSTADGPRAGETWVDEETCVDLQSDPVTLRTTDVQNATVESITATTTFSNATHFTIVLRGGPTAGPASVTLVPTDSEDGHPSVHSFQVHDPSYNRPPRCQPTPDVTVDPGASVALTPNGSPCSDDDRDAVTTTIVTPPARGRLTQQPAAFGPPVWTYTAGNKPGHDQVTLQFSDGHGGVDTRTVGITISDPATSINTVVSDAPGQVTNEAISAFTFRAPGHPGATFACRVFRYAAAAPAFAPCTSPYTTAKLPEGQYQFEVVASDGALTDPTPATWSFVLDVTAPPAPTFHELRDQTVEDVTSDGLAVGIGCTGCTARVLVRHGGDVVGRRTVDRAHIGVVRVPLDRRLRRLRRVALQVRTTVRDRAGNTRRVSRHVVLRHAT